MPSKTGGFTIDYNNDCLYYAIKYALNDKADALIKKPETWKKWLNIGRKDMIDYHDIRIIEDKIKCRINVVGDYIYQSSKLYSRVIQVTLKDGHYRFKNNIKIRKHLIKYKNYNSKLVYFKSVKENNLSQDDEETLMRFYDGLEITEKIFKYTDLVKSKTHSYVEHKEIDTPINEAYDKFMNDCTHFKQLTTVDLADFDHSVTDLCLSLFYKYSMCFEQEEMDEFEALIHLKCRRGGLMYANTTTDVQDKKMNCYDINSSYPSVMVKNAYPYTKPEYSILTEIPHSWGIGLYHVNIHNIDMRLMAISESHWYSSVDMNRATQLGYEIEMIQDGDINCLKYKQLILGNHLFGGYINDMYIHKNTINELTRQKNPIFKQVMNCLHGLLSQRDKKYYTNSETGKSFETHQPMNVTIGKRGERLVVKSQSSNFKRPYARIQTFIAAHARTKISKLVEPIKNDVYRIQTDSFLTTVDNIDIDNEIGGLKLEYTGNYKIHHVNKILCIKCGKTAKVCSVLGCC
jgi:hypothetical protein